MAPTKGGGEYKTPEIDKEMREKSEIVNISNDIKEKWNELKEVKSGIQRMASEYLQPMVQPLKTLTTSIEKERLKQKRTGVAGVTAATPHSVESKLKELKLPPLNNVFYGLKYDEEKKQFFIGEVPVDITENSITVGKKSYLRTPGLISLLTTGHFQSKKKYKKSDLHLYRTIIEETHAAKRSKGNPKPTKGPSYLFIKKLLSSPVYRHNYKIDDNDYDNNNNDGDDDDDDEWKDKSRQQDTIFSSDDGEGDITVMDTFSTPMMPKTGSGLVATATKKCKKKGATKKKKAKKINAQIRKRLMIPSRAEQEYIYYDDPNELVERLKLLYGEQLAGNVNNPQISNEIQHILEELEELGLIQ